DQLIEPTTNHANAKDDDHEPAYQHADDDSRGAVSGQTGVLGHIVKRDFKLDVTSPIAFDVDRVIDEILLVASSILGGDGRHGFWRGQGQLLAGDVGFRGWLVF